MYIGANGKRKPYISRANSTEVKYEVWQWASTRQWMYMCTINLDSRLETADVEVTMVDVNSYVLLVQN